MNSNKENDGWQRIILLITSYIFVVGIFQIIGYLIAGVDFSDSNHKETLLQDVIISVFDLLGTFFLIWFLMKYVDKEPFINLGFETKNRLMEFNVGIILGLVIMFFGFLILIYLKEIFFVRLNFDFNSSILTILLFTIVAFVEEVLFRGYILRNLMYSYNKYVALFISSILFSIIHGANPNFDVFSSFSLFLAGISLGISYIYTKNLWFPIAFHLSWNLFQTLFGFNVSGKDTYSIIEFNLNKKNCINGGDFGFEGSFISLFIEIGLILLIWFYFKKERKETMI